MPLAGLRVRPRPGVRIIERVKRQARARVGSFPDTASNKVAVLGRMSGRSQDTFHPLFDVDRRMHKLMADAASLHSDSEAVGVSAEAMRGRSKPAVCSAAAIVR